jgi:hypothetical protein
MNAQLPTSPIAEYRTRMPRRARLPNITVAAQLGDYVMRMPCPSRFERCDSGRPCSRHERFAEIGARVVLWRLWLADRGAVERFEGAHFELEASGLAEADLRRRHAMELQPLIQRRQDARNAAVTAQSTARTAISRMPEARRAELRKRYPGVQSQGEQCCVFAKFTATTGPYSERRWSCPLHGEHTTTQRERD